MRQHKMLTQTLLVLSILNFALTAPVAVLEKSEVHLDANVTRNVTTASQKRRGLYDGLSNTPGSYYSSPPSPVLTDTLSQMEGHLAEQHGYTGNPQPPLNSLGSSTGPRLPMAASLPPLPESWPGSDHVPPQSAVLADIMSQIAGQSGGRYMYTGRPQPLGSSTGLRLPVAASLSHPSPADSSPSDVPGSDHWHGPPQSAVSTDIMSQITEQSGGRHGYTGSSYPPPHGLLGSSTGPRLPVTDSLSNSPEGWPPNMPVSDHAPSQSAVSTDMSQITKQSGGPHRYATGSSSQPSPDSLESSTGQRLPMAGSPSHPPESLSPNVPGSDHVPPQSEVLADIMSQIRKQLGYSPTGSQQPPPDRPGPSTGSRLPSKSVASSLSPPLLPGPSRPDPSRYRIQRPPVFKVPGNRPTPPQSQGVDPKTHSSSLPNSEPFSTEFLDRVLKGKGKFKRRISSSDAASSAQRESRSRIFYP